MKINTLLRVIGIVALVILVIQVGSQYRHVKQGGKPASHGRAVMNWLLLAILVVSFGASFDGDDQLMLTTSADHVSQQASSQSQDQAAANLTIDIPDKVTMKDGEAKVRLTVPAGTKLQIYQGDKVVAAIDNSKQTRASKLSYLFNQAGTYRIVGIRNHQRFEKALVVSDGQEVASVSSSSSSQQSSSSQATAAAESSDDATATSNANSASNDDSPVPGYHYEYRTVQVPVYGNQQ